MPYPEEDTTRGFRRATELILDTLRWQQGQPKSRLSGTLMRNSEKVLPAIKNDKGFTLN
jgi:hypothetical protein